MTPAWYSKRYPTEADLSAFAEAIGAWVTLAPLPAAAFIPGEGGGPSVILIPNQHGPLATVWSLAHEIGHLCQHSGQKGRLFWSKDEAQANRWAACALIPGARVRLYNNASIDAFIASLSANYEDIPPENCPARCLAHKIAQFRLQAMASKGLNN
jgi:hypothetical protein